LLNGSPPDVKEAMEHNPDILLGEAAPARSTLIEARPFD
jgi:hypothetical protein